MNARPPPIQRLRRYWEHRSGEAALQEKAHRPTAGRHAFREGGFVLEGGMFNHTTEVLPIEALLPDLLETLGSGTRCILEAAPGAGKTTRVPLALLRAAWLDGKGILMLEPRRMAARNAARYMASLLGEKVGQTVGYRVRLDSWVSASTRITVVTEGVLTRMLQDDPELQGVGCLIFDEFHERSLNADLGLALALDCQQGLRDDLRLLIMSATLDSGPLLKLLQQDFSGAVPVLRSEGRAWPVETFQWRGGLRTPSGARCGRRTAVSSCSCRERAKSEKLKRYFKTCDRIPYIFVRCTAICPQRSRMPPLRRFGLRYGR